jgi:hypothetical protein
MRTSEVRVSAVEENYHPPVAYLFDVSYREREEEGHDRLVEETEEDRFFSSLEALIAHGAGALVVVR